MNSVDIAYKILCYGWNEWNNYDNSIIAGISSLWKHASYKILWKDLLYSACEHDNIRIINYLYTVVKISVEDFLGDNGETLKIAARYDKVNIFKYFFEVIGVEIEDLNFGKIFNIVCYYNSIKVVKYLFEIMKLNYYYFYGDFNSCFFGKSLNVVKYLFENNKLSEKFSIKSSETFSERYVYNGEESEENNENEENENKDENDYDLCDGVIINDTDELQFYKYLFEVVGVDLIFFRQYYFDTFVDACENNHVKVVEYLFEVVGYSIEDFKGRCIYNVLKYFNVNNSEVLKYLFENEYLNSCDFKNEYEIAVMCNSKLMLKYCIEIVGIDIFNFNIIYIYDIFQEAKKCENYDVCEYLSMLGFDEQNIKKIVERDIKMMNVMSSFGNPNLKFDVLDKKRKKCDNSNFIKNDFDEIEDCDFLND